MQTTTRWLACAAAGHDGARLLERPFIEDARGIGAYLQVRAGPGAPGWWLAAYGPTRCVVQPRGARGEASPDVDHVSVRMRGEPAKVADIVAIECADRHRDRQPFQDYRAAKPGRARRARHGKRIGTARGVGCRASAPRSVRRGLADGRYARPRNARFVLRVGWDARSSRQKSAFDLEFSVAIGGSRFQ